MPFYKDLVLFKESTRIGFHASMFKKPNFFFTFYSVAAPLLILSVKLCLVAVSLKPKKHSEF